MVLVAGPKLNRRRSPGTTRYSGTRLQSIDVVSAGPAFAAARGRTTSAAARHHPKMREVNSAPERDEAFLPGYGKPDLAANARDRRFRTQGVGASSTTHRKGQRTQEPFRSEVANGVSGNLRRHPELLKTPHRKRREYRQRLTRLSTIRASFRPLETASRKRCAAGKGCASKEAATVRARAGGQAGCPPSAASTPAAKSGTMISWCPVRAKPRLPSPRVGRSTTLARGR